ncbi:hypothetical protein [Cryobacterium sp. Y29]|jgi:PhnB protein|uniref:hypothetical protein n=1 Tax=Cryobacterium sp. Y29 TaxID=2048285 RepID=UPI00351A16A3
MSSRLNPYLGFRDNAREAMDFYQSVFGGDVARTTYGEYNAGENPAEKDKIMHSELTSTRPNSPGTGRSWSTAGPT